MLLHENYKAQAACAVHCLYENHARKQDATVIWQNHTIYKAILLTMRC